MEPRTKRPMYHRNEKVIQSNESVKRFFENAEPYFKAIFEENKKLTISEKMTFKNLFEDFNQNVLSNIYDMIIKLFQQRIKAGFEYSINSLKQYSVDETFTQHVKDELDKFAYAKDVLLFVFKTQKYGKATGSGVPVDKIVHEYWDRDYYNLLKERIQLPEEAHALFAHLNQN